MTLSLIITTYNWPEALDSVLASVLEQSRLPDEIIVADDGSGDATRNLIAAWQHKSPIPLVHSWQQDLGFRLSESRNKAIKLARGEYIVMIDGDLSLHKHFIKDHLQAATPGFFISGKRVRMTEKLSKAVMSQQSRPRWFSQGLYRGRCAAIRFPWLSRQLAMTKTESVDSIHGCNMSFWREDALKVNGFNIAFEGWGPEDKEFAARLIHSGVKRKVLKFAGIAFHLYHPESSKAMLEKNIQLFDRCLCERQRRCEFGLAQSL